MRLAILNSWPNLPVCAEKEFIVRSLLALREMGWDAAEVVTSDDIERVAPDCVLTTHEFSPKLTPVPTLGLMWSPLEFFYNDPVRIRSLMSYDGYLSGSPQVRSYLKDLLYSTGKNAPVSDFAFWPSCYRTEIAGRLPDRRTVFYAGVGWDGQRHGSIFESLRGRVSMAYYGPPAAWRQAGDQYRGSITVDGRSVLARIRESGVALCIHRVEHRTGNAPSMRLFEAAAAGAVILTDRMPFTSEHFGDSVLYLDMEQPHEAIAEQIAEHVRWIDQNPAQAEEKARAAHAIFNRDFCLEEQYQKLPAFLDQVRTAGRFHLQPSIVGAAVSSGEVPRVEYIVRVGSRPVAMIERCLDGLKNQTYQNLGVILVQYKPIEGFDDLVARYRKVFRSLIVVPAPAGMRSAAYWAGLNAVTAPYFGNCDDDDWLAPNHVATVLEAMKRQPNTSFAYSGTIQVEEEPGHYTKLPNFAGAAAFEIPENRSLRFFDDFDFNRLMKIDSTINSNSWIARRELLDERLLQDPGMHYAEDYFLLLAFLAKTPFAFSWRPTAQWHWRSTSQDNSAFESKAHDGINRVALLFRFQRWNRAGATAEIGPQYSSFESNVERRLAALEAKVMHIDLLEGRLAALEHGATNLLASLHVRVSHLERLAETLRGFKRAIFEPQRWPKRLWRTCQSIGRNGSKGVVSRTAGVADGPADR